jgi:hypothetical protein
MKLSMNENISGFKNKKFKEELSKELLKLKAQSSKSF